MSIMERVLAPRELRRRFADARSRTDELFNLVQTDSLFERPVPERHRLNFYIGHLEAFDWNMICGYSLGLDPFNSEFNELFAFGIDPDSSDLPSDQPADWPSLAETQKYCRRVQETVDEVLDDVPGDVAQVCLEHRLMHAETLCCLLHNLDPVRVRVPPEPQTEPVHTAAVRSSREWIDIPAGNAMLGRGRQTGFGWDNEFGESRVHVPGFAITKYKVTNGEFLKYVEDGGSAPYYWRNDGRCWLLRTMFGEIPLPLEWPVYVTHRQAWGYAAQADATLPSEAQWDRAAYGSGGDSYSRYPWGDDPPQPRRGNFNFQRWDPCSVRATAEGDSAYGVSQLMGNGWEWTSDPFRPFPGFEEFPFYPGYSSNFFDDQHYVLKGGSPRTALLLLRRTFRNWFRQEYPYVFSTFRLVSA